ncbi:MAG: helix-turn-helix transcriptional regulator [Candidatus Caenarcaniphilales bacterium]|nr:helix-turn-helix transcriptional regulator [Candidatus Caenarcaniphilales bacterium]
MDYESLLLQSLAQVIRQKRSEQNYSQESFADEVGVHRTYMGSIERGERNVTFRNLVRVAKGLGILTSALIEEAEIHLNKK